MIGGMEVHAEGGSEPCQTSVAWIGVLRSTSKRARFVHPRICRRALFSLAICMCLSAVSPIEDPHDRAASVEEWRARRAADLSRHHDSECKAGGSCRVDGGIADTDAAAGIDDEAMHGLLVVELSFGGLSNRRQALMQAVAAAKLLRRRLVLGDEFDSPHPTSFGPCFNCVRPLAHYFDVAGIAASVPLSSYEDLYSLLETEPKPRLRTFCKFRCLHSPPDWVSDAQWDRVVVPMQTEEEVGDAGGLLPMPHARFLHFVGTVPEQILWIDSGFRLLELGGFRSLFDGNKESKDRQSECFGCLTECRSSSNPEVAAAGWCDAGCRARCQQSCAAQCRVDQPHLARASRQAALLLRMHAALVRHLLCLLGLIQAEHLPPVFDEAVRAVDYAGSLKTRARALARELQPAVDTLVCAHWRTGDWAFPLSSEALVASVRGAVELHYQDKGAQGGVGGGGLEGSVGVFVATDATAEQRQELSRSLRLVSPCPHGPCGLSNFSTRENDWNPWDIDTVEAAILEQLVCAEAQVFVGTRGSTFSEAIVEERYRRGHALTSNYLIP